MTNILTISSASKTYPQTAGWAVEDFSLDVAEEEFFCIVGPSGCGKSTVLKMIAGLEEPTSGTINKPDNVSMVFQSGALLPWLTVADNVGFGLKMEGKSTSQTKELVEKHLHMVGLTEFAQKYPRELSGGQRQRVGIARALAVSPQVLLLDEPFSALDQLITEELHKDLIAIWQETKITVVMVSHLLGEAVLLGDRIGVMKEGKLRGVVEDDLPRPRNVQSKEFLALVRKVRELLD